MGLCLYFLSVLEGDANIVYAVDGSVRDTLYNELPMSYDDGALNHYRQTIYEYVFSYYKDVA